jgi:hypothetical protein
MRVRKKKVSEDVCAAVLAPSHQVASGLSHCIIQTVDEKDGEFTTIDQSLA